MKIRIRNQFIRLRLDKMDIERLRNEGKCMESVAFGEERFVFLLKDAAEDPSHLKVSPFGIEIGLANESLGPLLDASFLSYSCELEDEKAEKVKILVERDFKCLVPRAEEDRHGFEHPMEGKAVC